MHMTGADQLFDVDSVIPQVRRMLVKWQILSVPVTEVVRVVRVVPRLVVVLVGGRRRVRLRRDKFARAKRVIPGLYQRLARVVIIQLVASLRRRHQLQFLPNALVRVHTHVR